jgi:HK97 family phage major capsid protein
MTERTGTQLRHFEFDVEGRAAGDESIPVVISSDAVVDVVDGPEILVHAPDAIDLQRAPLPIIATHRSGQVNIGVIDNLTISGGKLRGDARFGSRDEAAGYKADVLNKIIRSVSVGYARVKAHIRADGVMVTTRWMPTHTALVAEPADINAGFFRSLESVPAFELVTDTTPPKGTSMKGKIMADTATLDAPAGATAVQMSDNVAHNLERARASNLQRLATQYKVDADTAQRWIEQGVSLDEAGNEVVKILAARSKEDASKSKLDMSKKDLKGYSIMRAINAVLNKNWNGAGLELEASQEISRRIGRTVNEHTFFVPLDVQQRDLIVGTSTMGGYLVSTGNVGFIELLRNRSVLFNMGATRLSGLQGSVAVPRQTAPGTGFWLATEATAATESQMVIGQMTLTPKNVGAYTEISRQLLLQGSPDAEGLVMSDLAAVIALAVDSAGLTGTGAPQPQGIVGTAGLGGVTITTGTVTYANVLEFQTDAATANALTPASGYVTTPAIAAILKQKARFSNTDTPIWQGNVLDGNIEGIRAMTSNQVTAGQLLMGDFSKVVIGEWGTLEVEANPYANFAAGIVGVRAFYTCDVGVRYPGAFSLGTGITA